MTVWMDMTNSLETHSGEAKDITLVELMLAKMLHKIDKNIKFSILSKYGFAEVDSTDINWLWESNNIPVDYKKYKANRKHLHKNFIYQLKRYKNKLIYEQECNNQPKDLRADYIANPYKNGDTIYSCGWCNQEKETRFENIKKFYPDIKIVYTVHDIASLQDSLKHCYISYNTVLENFLYWISENCDAVIYRGETALKDTEKYLHDLNYRIPKGYYFRCCNETFKNQANQEKDNIILERLNIKSPFIVAAGPFDYLSNYKVLYKVYCLLAQKHSKNIPELVIVGDREENCLNELFDAFNTNPLISNKVKMLKCTEEELDVLYRNCKFTVLPSLYEGYSTELTQYLAYNKLTLCSDIVPLREVADGFAEFLNPNHPKDWADKIEYYMEHPDEIKKAEENIKQNWKPVSWQETAETVHKYLKEISAQDYLTKSEELNNNIDTKSNENSEPHIYYDFSYIDFPQLCGIPRAEIIIGRELYKIKNDITFYTMRFGEYHEIPVSCLQNTLLSDKNIDESVKMDNSLGLEFNWKRKLPFTKNDIVISLGMAPNQKIYEQHKNLGFKYISTIYDMTPFTVPHTHQPATIDYIKLFLDQAYEVSDLILYGGENAKIDSDRYQKELNLTPVNSCTLKWGSDIVSKELTPERKEKVFEKYKIKDNFILTVGTIQPRKNHNILYEAWLEMLNTRSEGEEIPQLVICGNMGWKADSFIDELKNDTRVKDDILWITPTDDELDVLYQTCKFTVLPSIYEGWSLTLPESLNYGKFCLASDTPSLKETGEDIIDYANPYDPVDWAEKIRYYYNNQNALAKRENMIKEKWTNPTWTECAQEINNAIDKIMQKEEVLL